MSNIIAAAEITNADATTPDMFFLKIQNFQKYVRTRIKFIGAPENDQNG
jgi:hypothetical protein